MSECGQQPVLLAGNAPVSCPSNNLQASTSSTLSVQGPLKGCKAVLLIMCALSIAAFEHIRQAGTCNAWQHLLEYARQSQEADEHDQYDIARRVQQ